MRDESERAHGGEREEDAGLLMKQLGRPYVAAAPTGAKCPFLHLLDPRCFLARASGLLVADIVYYCGGHGRECPHYERIANNSTAK